MAANNQQETGGNDTKEEEEQKAGMDALRLGVHCTKDDRLKVSVIPPPLPKQLKRLPAVLCCVVDISGSMGSEATITDANGKTESDGLTILDLVKHSIKTIIHCLDKNDYLSIVSYSSKATIVTQLTQMTKPNKKKTLTALDNLQHAGQTNLWDGLVNGLEVLRTNKHIDCAKNNSAVCLFTDGLPNIIPPKGHMGMLDKYIDTHQELAGIVNTYGFGYSLDTKLLNELAIAGNGSYAFIPDSSFVGTIFVNSISNFCSNIAKNCMVKIEVSPKYDVEVVGGYDYLRTSWGLQVNLGNIMYAQNKDIVLQFAAKDMAKEEDSNTVDEEGKEGGQGQGDNMYDLSVASLNYISLRHNKLIANAHDIIDDDGGNNRATEMNYYRLLACDVLRGCMKSMQLNSLDEAQNALKELIKLIQSNKEVQKEKYIQGLLEDLSGQAFEAISKKAFYDKWGKHYLPSLVFAHLHQYNNNFKDPGVQNYGGELFNNLRDNANDIFIKLPPPKPSKPQYKYTGTGANKKKYKAPPVNMKNYYNAGGGCFAGNCNVLMGDNTYKKVSDLCVADIVSGGARIQCVVKHKCDGNKIKLSNIASNGLLITPYHPICIGNEWVFPVDVADNTMVYECDYVYNFVLAQNHVMNVNGIQCCTLGHGIKGNAVIEHEYFGTNQIVQDLRKLNGWRNGMVVLNKNSFKRNLNTNLVYGIME